MSGGYLSDPGRKIKTAHHHSSQHRQVAGSEWRVDEWRREENKANRGKDGRVALRVAVRHRGGVDSVSCM